MKRRTRYLVGALAVGLSVYLAVTGVLTLSAATEAFRGLWLAGDQHFSSALQEMIASSPERVRRHLLAVNLRLQLDDPGLEQSISQAKQTVDSYLAEVHRTARLNWWWAAALALIGIVVLGDFLPFGRQKTTKSATEPADALIKSLHSTPAVLCGADGCVTWVSQTFCEATSLEAVYVIGQELSTLAKVLSGGHALQRLSANDSSSDQSISLRLSPDQAPFRFRQARLGALTAAYLVPGEQPEAGTDGQAPASQGRIRALEASTEILQQAKSKTEAELATVKAELDKIRRHSSLEHLAMVGAVLNAADPILLCDGSGRVRACNAAWHELSGMSKEDSLHRPIEVVLHELGIEAPEIDGVGHTLDCTVRGEHRVCHITPAVVDGFIAQYLVTIHHGNSSHERTA